MDINFYKRHPRTVSFESGFPTIQPWPGRNTAALFRTATGQKRATKYGSKRPKPMLWEPSPSSAEYIKTIGYMYSGTLPGQAKSFALADCQCVNPSSCVALLGYASIKWNNSQREGGWMLSRNLESGWERLTESFPTGRHTQYDLVHTFSTPNRHATVETKVAELRHITTIENKLPM